jgi:electron transport complex protein RnfC
MDLPAGIEHLRRRGVWADRWTTPDLLGQLRQCVDKPIEVLLCSVLDESPDLLLHHELAARFPVELVAGVVALARLTGAKEILAVLAAFGDTGAWEAMRRASDDTAIKLVPLRDHYPQAHPTLLIHEVTGRHSRPVRPPVDAGVLMLDAAAAIAVGRCFLHDTPMLSVPVGFRQRLHDQTHWLDVPIGMPWSQVLAHLSIPPATVDLRAGNPLREMRLSDDCVASGAEHCIMASPRERFLTANACIRCAWCVEGCPVHIQPAGLLEAAQQDDPYLGDTYGLDACIECGICSYVCPSHLPILAGIRSLRSSGARNPAARK